MIVAVMYGMTPSAKIDSCSSAPPENRLTSDSRPSVPALAARQACTFGKSTKGAGTCAPSRYRAMIASVNAIFRRRSGVRKTRAIALNKRMPPEGMPVRDGAHRQQE